MATRAVVTKYPLIIGEMLIMPTIDSTVSRLATAQMIGVFFGLAIFISGLGEGTGNYAGGRLLVSGPLL
ncbi:hypothetical protein [Paenibacillus agricola]|nr:hypothetical protein [Paenibacillus agricola]